MSQLRPVPEPPGNQPGTLAAVRERLTAASRTASEAASTAAATARAKISARSGPSAPSLDKPGSPPARRDPLEPTLVALVSSASKDLSAQLKAEIELAKIDIQDDVKHAGIGAGMFGAAAGLGLFAALLLSFALVYGLVEAGLDTWLSFLIVALVYLLVAGLVGFLGYRQVRRIRPPTDAIEAVKGTVAALKGTG